MYCAKCGTECQPEYKFCKNCGAVVGAAYDTQLMAAQPAENLQAMPIPATPQAPPPGMVPMVYQTHPGAPQQVYYVPAQGAQTSLLEGLRSRIRNLASTDKLEGFSLSQTFSETFMQRGAEAVEEYMMVGSSRTTPSIETVETGWPRPWMFFRLLVIFAIASAVLYAAWVFTGNVPLISAVLIMGAFGMPLATLMFLFEMNTPRNVSLVVLGKLFVIGGLAASCVVSFEYMKFPGPIAGDFPGIVEETAKFAMVLLVMRSARYKYVLNGILFGAAVGAGFAAFETTFYGFVSFLQVDQAGGGGALAAHAMATELMTRAIGAPFAHVAWTAIAAGAFWRIKQDQPTSLSMLMDTRFLKAFAIPVLMHSLWDLSVDFPSLATNSTRNTVINWSLEIGTGLVTWYVLFGLIQQGLRQVKDEQTVQLKSTLANVEATLGLGAKRPHIPMPAPMPSSGATPA